MGAVIDLTGKKFGRWSVVGLSHQKGSMLYWSCVCECGIERAVFGADLKRGGSKSCGCLSAELKSAMKTTHGMVSHPAYRSWVGLRSRCNGPNNNMRHLYGGRGISVCSRWDAFDLFWEDMGPTWRAGLSIDRINTNGNYEPSNCKWSNAQEQGSNRRTNHIIPTPEGPMTVSNAARRFGISKITIFSRLKYGWDERDLLAPVRKTSRIYGKQNVESE